MIANASASNFAPPPSGAAAVPLARVLVVDDHPVFRHGIATMLNREEDIAVCGEVGDASSALESVRAMRPDVVLLDLSLPDRNGDAIIPQLKAEHATLFILVLSMHEESVYALRVLRVGARGYIIKSESAQCLTPAIRTVYAGGTYLSPRLRERKIFQTLAPTDGHPSRLTLLSNREREVLDLIGLGRSTRGIAEELCVSVKTVETHRAHLKEKLDLRDGGELVRFAVDLVAAR